MWLTTQCLGGSQLAAVAPLTYTASELASTGKTTDLSLCHDCNVMQMIQNDSQLFPSTGVLNKIRANTAPRDLCYACVFFSYCMLLRLPLRVINGDQGTTKWRNTATNWYERTQKMECR